MPAPMGKGTTLLEAAGVPAKLPSGSDDPGLVLHPSGPSADALRRFIDAIAKHRHFARELDPPGV